MSRPAAIVCWKSAAVEIIDRRVTGERFHRYIHPQREIDDAAIEVHGLTLSRLLDKPKFEEVAAEFLAFVRDAEVIIHNAPFDVSFIDYELSLLPTGPALHRGHLQGDGFACSGAPQASGPTEQLGCPVPSLRGR